MDRRGFWKAWYQGVIRGGVLAFAAWVLVFIWIFAVSTARFPRKGGPTQQDLALEAALRPWFFVAILFIFVAYWFLRFRTNQGLADKFKTYASNAFGDSEYDYFGLFCGWHCGKNYLCYSLGEDHWVKIPWSEVVTVCRGQDNMVLDTYGVSQKLEPTYFYLVKSEWIVVYTTNPEFPVLVCSVGSKKRAVAVFDILCRKLAEPQNPLVLDEPTLVDFRWPLSHPLVIGYGLLLLLGYQERFIAALFSSSTLIAISAFGFSGDSHRHILYDSLMRLTLSKRNRQTGDPGTKLDVSGKEFVIGYDGKSEYRQWRLEEIETVEVEDNKPRWYHLDITNPFQGLKPISSRIIVKSKDGKTDLTINSQPPELARKWADKVNEAIGSGSSEPVKN